MLNSRENTILYQLHQLSVSELVQLFCFLFGYMHNHEALFLTAVESGLESRKEVTDGQSDS